MERTKHTKTIIPDGINCSVSQDFTQIPNKLLRNPNISGKAKALLCLLLSNKKGWGSNLASIETMMQEKSTAIRSGLNELEKYDYLFRIRYREKGGKHVIKGTLWLYTDTQNEFHLPIEIIQQLDKGDLYLENLNLDNLNIDNQTLIILIDKKTKKEKDYYSSDFPNNLGNITSSQFEKFWKLYPRKVDKGKASTKWKSICSQPAKNRPLWKEIKKAIITQKKSERWQDPNFIPHPTTWLNQKRWLDDPAEMKVYTKNGNELGSRRFGSKITYDKPSKTITRNEN